MQLGYLATELETLKEAELAATVEGILHQLALLNSKAMDDSLQSAHPGLYESFQSNNDLQSSLDTIAPMHQGMLKGCKDSTWQILAVGFLTACGTSGITLPCHSAGECVVDV